MAVKMVNGEEIELSTEEYDQVLLGWSEAVSERAVRAAEKLAVDQKETDLRTTIQTKLSLTNEELDYLQGK